MVQLSAKQLCLALVLFGASAKAQVELPMCPSGYCVHRKYEGNSAHAFQCAQLPETYHQCAFEGGPCLCNGEVTYGNYAKWGETKLQGDGTTPVMCNNDQPWGGVVNGAKFCICHPKDPITQSSMEPGYIGDAASAPEGYTLPTCMYTEGQIHLLIPGLQNDPDYPFFEGAARLAMNFAVGGILDHLQVDLMGPQTILQKLNMTDMTFMMKVPAGDDIKKVVTTIDALRGEKEAGEPLKTALTDFLKRPEMSDLKDIGMMAALIELQLFPAPGGELPTTAAPTAPPADSDVSGASSVSVVGALGFAIFCTTAV